MIGVQESKNPAFAGFFDLGVRVFRTIPTGCLLLEDFLISAS